MGRIISKADLQLSKEAAAAFEGLLLLKLWRNKQLLTGNTAVTSQEARVSHQTTLQRLLWVEEGSKVSQQITLISQDVAQLPKKWHHFL